MCIEYHVCESVQERNRGVQGGDFLNAPTLQPFRANGFTKKGTVYK